MFNWNEKKEGKKLGFEIQVINDINHLEENIKDKIRVSNLNFFCALLNLNMEFLVNIKIILFISYTDNYGLQDSNKRMPKY